MTNHIKYVRVSFLYADEKEMLRFVEDNIDKVSGVFYSDDFDGCYWIVTLRFYEKK